MLYSLDEHTKKVWMEYGGRETLRSFGGEIPKSYIKYFQRQKLYKVYSEYKDEKKRPLVVSHARVSSFFKNLENPYQKYRNKNGKREYLQNIRGEEDNRIVWNRDFEKIKSPEIFNIFGHTIVDSIVEKNPETSQYKKEGVIINKEEAYAAIDTGMGYGKDKYLSAIAFPSLQVIREKNTTLCSKLTNKIA